MNAPEYTPDVLAQVSRLEERFKQEGQNLTCHLEGLYHSRHINYWDYINLDSLLSLQQPRTNFRDEIVFIIYHQLSELYFKLILQEMEQITQLKTGDAGIFLTGIERINRYYEQLISSFSIMTEGMDPAQFSQFRMALFPASGFQSVQYRLIEIHATALLNLVHEGQRSGFSGNEKTSEIFKQLYWSNGAIETVSGKKDLSAIYFDKKYAAFLLYKAKALKKRNIWHIFNKYFAATTDSQVITEGLRKMDQLVNIEWPLTHYKAAARHLQKKGQPAAAGTGGTNWRKYLPPFNRKIIFYPDLWTAAEKEHWGMPLKMRDAHQDS